MTRGWGECRMTEHGGGELGTSALPLALAPTPGPAACRRADRADCLRYLSAPGVFLLVRFASAPRLDTASSVSSAHYLEEDSAGKSSG